MGKLSGVMQVLDTAVSVLEERQKRSNEPSGGSQAAIRLGNLVQNGLKKYDQNRKRSNAALQAQVPPPMQPMPQRPTQQWHPMQQPPMQQWHPTQQPPMQQWHPTQQRPPQQWQPPPQQQPQMQRPPLHQPIPQRPPIQPMQHWPQMQHPPQYAMPQAPPMQPRPPQTQPKPMQYQTQQPMQQPMQPPLNPWVWAGPGRYSNPGPAAPSFAHQPTATQGSSARPSPAAPLPTQQSARPPRVPVGNGSSRPPQASSAAALPKAAKPSAIRRLFSSTPKPTMPDLPNLVTHGKYRELTDKEMGAVRKFAESDVGASQRGYDTLLRSAIEAGDGAKVEFMRSKVVRTEYWRMENVVPREWRSSKAPD